MISIENRKTKVLTLVHDTMCSSKSLFSHKAASLLLQLSQRKEANVVEG
jgi:hypothetical protein